MQQLTRVIALMVLLSATWPSFSQTVIILNRVVSTGTDDAEEAAAGGTGTLGAMDLTSVDLELMTDGTKRQIIGIRFGNITIPKGATINSVFIQFATKGDKTPVSGAITIKGQDIDNAATFTTGASNISARAVTIENVVWPGSTSSTWGKKAIGIKGADQKTPDLKAIVQALVNRSGWASGNAMAFVLSGDGVRNASSYDNGAAVAPELIIQYTFNANVVNTFPIAAGSAWKYFDQGVLPAANWADSNSTFNDAGWITGNAKLGYNDTAITTVSFGPDAANKYITTYFRYAFDMSNTLLTDSLILRILRDDGAVVYMNGNEIFRSNMPAGIIGNNTLAITDVAGQDEKAFFSTVIKNNLVNGRNVIAVELHQASIFTDDAGFDLQLFAKQTPSNTATVFPVAKNSTWNYLDDGTDQGTAWKDPGFYPGPWNYGPAKLGYSDTPATALGFGPAANNKYITYYFRKQFSVAATAVLADSLELSVLRDDGAIVYINGMEVWRTNMPAGVFEYRTFSSTVVDGVNESIYFTFRLPKSVLINGINTIAVEVHQRDGSSSDLGFDLELKEYTAPGGALLIRGPYLQVGTPTSMNIRWRTDLANNSRVRWGTSPADLINVIDSAASVTEHEIKISGLNPLSKYYYSIGSSNNTLQGNADNYFSTLPVEGGTGLLRIGVFGDCGNNSTNQINVRNQVQNYLGSNYMNSWILLGDNAYSNGTDAEFQAAFFNIYKDRFLKQNPLYPAPGNHDYNNGSAVAQNDHNVPYYSIFSMPTKAEAGGTASNNKAYYSFNVGNVHFLSLDSYGKEDNATRLYDTLGKQVTWIKADLAANTNKTWIVAYWHHPPFTKGSHNSDTESELVSIRTNFIRILERLGVDMILCGHSHDYERSKLQLGHYGVESTFNSALHNQSTSTGLYNGTANSCPYTKDSVTRKQGTVYVVSGSAGQLGGTTSGYPHNAMQYSDATNGGAMMLEVEGNRLDAKWINADGGIRDRFTMMKDVKIKKDTAITAGGNITLTASYIGAYSWLPGNQTTRSVTVTPPVGTTTYIVRDASNCIADTFNVTATGIPPVTQGNIRGWYQKNSATIQLQFQSITETGNPYFEIQSAADGINFNNVGKVNSNGNPGAAYSFTDKNIKAGVPVLYYRIKQVDADGSYRYSMALPINTTGAMEEADVQVLPNPGRSSDMKIRLLNTNALSATIKLSDAYGRIVNSRQVTLNESLQSFLPDVQPGNYFVTIIAEGTIITRKIVVQ